MICHAFKTANYINPRETDFHSGIAFVSSISLIWGEGLRSLQWLHTTFLSHCGVGRWGHLSKQTSVSWGGGCGTGSLTPRLLLSSKARHWHGSDDASLQMCTLKIHTGKPHHPLSHFSFHSKESSIFKSFQWQASISRSDKISCFKF